METRAGIERDIRNIQGFIKTLRKEIKNKERQIVIWEDVIKDYRKRLAHGEYE